MCVGHKDFDFTAEFYSRGFRNGIDLVLEKWSFMFFIMFHKRVLSLMTVRRNVKGGKTFTVFVIK